MMSARPSASPPSSPSPSRLARLGAVCGVLSGLLIALPALVEAVTGETAATSYLLALSPAFAMPLLVALHRRQASLARWPARFGETAFVLNLLGLGLFGGAAFASNMVLFYLEDAVVEDVLGGPTLSALIGSATVFAVSCALFGAAMIRARAVPAIAAWGYAVVLPLFAFLIALPDSVLTSALHVAAGAVLTWLATWLGDRDGGRARQPVPSPRVAA